MKTRPIIFNSEMVRALLDGRKTQTRRVCKLTDSGRVKAAGSHRNWHLADPDAVLACPYGQPGDLLWVRETWGMSYVDIASERPHTLGGEWGSPSRPGRAQCVVYRADGDTMPEDPGYEVARWRPPIHMPRWASRLTLEITDVRVQRVQGISGEDAMAEGVRRDREGSGWLATYTIAGFESMSTRGAFRGLWDSINAKRGFGWDADPWVWAITFKVHRCNVDQVAEIRE